MTDDLPAFIRAQLDAEAKLIRHLNCDDVWTAVAGACGPEVYVQPASPYSSGKPSAWERTEVPYSVWDCDDFSDYEGCASMRDSWMAEAEFIAAHNPASALADIEVKRRILARHRPATDEDLGWSSYVGACFGCGTYGEFADARTPDINDCPELRDLAAPYAERPGHNPTWRVE